MALAGLVALLVAGLLLLARLLRFGFLADFLSRTVLVGFLAGVGIQEGIAVSGGMLGLPAHSRRTVQQLLEVAGHLHEANWSSFGLAAAVVAGVLLLGRLTPRIPVPLIAVVAAIAATAHWNFANHAIEILGSVPGGLRHVGLPAVAWKAVLDLLPVSASSVVMIMAQSAATARIYAIRHHQTLDEDADLAGLCAANAAAALSGTFVATAAPPKLGWLNPRVDAARRRI